MPTLEPEVKRLVDQVKEAADTRDPEGRGVAMEVVGGMTKRFYGGPASGMPLDLRMLRGISSYEPTELVITARAGTPLVELEAVLAEKGQCLPFEPPRFGDAGTVGGMVAAGLAGPARVSAGSVRDYVLGVTLLNGLGEVLSFGGQVMKNVAGYDVSRLVPGSLGILGPMLEVSLKVLPVLPATLTLAWDVDAPKALAMLDGWRRQPLPLAASSWYRGRLNVRLAGARAAVTAAASRLGGTALPAAEAETWWLGLRDQTHAFFALDPQDSKLAVWRLSAAQGAGGEPLLPAGECLIEWGGAQRWWRTAASSVEVRAVALALRGHATRYRSAQKVPDPFTQVGDPLMSIHRRLKAAFDPASVFNRGRLYPGL